MKEKYEFTEIYKTASREYIFQEQNPHNKKRHRQSPQHRPYLNHYFKPSLISLHHSSHRGYQKSLYSPLPT